MQLAGGTTITSPLPGAVADVPISQVFSTSATPTFSGVATAGSQVVAIEDGTIIGTVSINAMGNWTFSCTTLTTGLHRLSFEAVNQAGVFSAEANSTMIWA